MKTETKITTVETRRWAPDDDYQVIETQVFDIPARTPVRITIQPISREEYEAYLRGETDAMGNKL